MISPKFAFSLNGENYTGTYDTRQAALTAGLAAAALHSDPPSTLFVARRTAPDLQTTGHAAWIIRDMQRRMKKQTGLEGYLAGLTEHDEAALDEQIARVIENWILSRNLAVDSDQVEAISEQTVPVPAKTAGGYQEQETNELG